MTQQYLFDAVIVGGGHNGLIAACYLAMAGRQVLILEKNDALGGATRSESIFPGVNARLSVYAYLVSLLPHKIISDLGIHFQTRRRAMAAYTPHQHEDRSRGFILSNLSEEVSRQSFEDFFGDEREYHRYRTLEQKLRLFAQKVWPTLLSPLPSRQALRAQFQTREERQIWEYLVEQPLAMLIEDHISDDTLRGLVFTDAKIGVSTYPEDSTLLQNRTFLYHILGQGTGEWQVPVGGMGALVDALTEKALSLGVTFRTSAEVIKVDHATPASTVYYIRPDQQISAVETKFVLFNVPSNIANRCLPNTCSEYQVEGSVFKMNMILKRLPHLKDARVSSRDAFTGTFHLNEGYEQMKISFQSAQWGFPMETIPGEMYCHSLTDPSILSPALQAQGFQSLTLFGLDVPYRWFLQENDQVKADLTQKFIQSINSFLEDDFNECLALDSNGRPCLDVKSPLDLELRLGLPMGNIFHGNLTWPFAERQADSGAWGVETNYENVYLCGSSAIRGGAVSGIPGHNAAMIILGTHK